MYLDVSGERPTNRPDSTCRASNAATWRKLWQTWRLRRLHQWYPKDWRHLPWGLPGWHCFSSLDVIGMIWCWYVSYVSSRLSVHLSIYSRSVSIYPPVNQPYLSIYIYIFLYVYIYIYIFEKAAIEIWWNSVSILRVYTSLSWVPSKEWFEKAQGELDKELRMGHAHGAMLTNQTLRCWEDLRSVQCEIWWLLTIIWHVIF